jgi:hypothetical protein
MRYIGLAPKGRMVLAQGNALCREYKPILHAPRFCSSMSPFDKGDERLRHLVWNKYFELDKY